MADPLAFVHDAEQRGTEGTAQVMLAFGPVQALSAQRSTLGCEAFYIDA